MQRNEYSYSRPDSTIVSIVLIHEKQRESYQIVNGHALYTVNVRAAAPETRAKAGTAVATESFMIAMQSAALLLAPDSRGLL